MKEGGGVAVQSGFTMDRPVLVILLGLTLSVILRAHGHFESILLNPRMLALEENAWLSILIFPLLEVEVVQRGSSDMIKVT